MGTVNEYNTMQWVWRATFILLLGAFAALSGSVRSAGADGTTKTTTSTTSPAPTPSIAAPTEVTGIAAPTEVTAQAGNGQATVSWVDPVLNDQTIEYYTIGVHLPESAATHPPVEATTAETRISQGKRSYLVRGLSNGTPYYFVVQVVFAQGMSEPSLPTVAVTPNVTPINSSSAGKSGTSTSTRSSTSTTGPVLVHSGKSSTPWKIIALALLILALAEGGVLFFRQNKKKGGNAIRRSSGPGDGHSYRDHTGAGGGSTNGTNSQAAPLLSTGGNYMATPPPLVLGPAGQNDVVFMKADPTPDYLTSACRRVMPHFTDQGVVWATGDPGLFAGGLWSEKKAGKGEDAEPTFVLQPAARRLLISVFDGLGGAGGAVSRQTLRGSVTQAYEASRLTRDVIESWFRSQPGGPLDPATCATQLQGELSARLQAYSSTLPKASSGLVGTMKRSLPTTLAAVLAEFDETNARVTALWAGDSRCYILTPGSGLQQISRDDTRIQDALEALLADPPLDNVVCTDRGFTIGHATLTVTQPTIVLVATDGCFGYVPTPPMFEAQILSTLQEASDAGSWMPSLLGLLEHQAQDDTSLAVAAIGFPDFTSMKTAFQPRSELIRRAISEPVAAHRAAHGDGDGRAEFEEFRTASWSSYKQNYEAYLPARPVVT